MKIIVLGEPYDVSETTGRRFYAHMAKGLDELDAVEAALAITPAERETSPVVVNVEAVHPPMRLDISRDENGKIVGIAEVPA